MAPDLEASWEPKPIASSARALARGQPASRRSGGWGDFRGSLRRLRRSLRAAYEWLEESSEAGERHPRVAEWLLDNEYLTHGALRHVRETIGRAFHRDLPKLDRGTAAEAGRPRVGRLAQEIVGDARTRFDVEHLVRFLDAYQTRRPLTIAEIWALPAALELETLEALAATTERLRRGEDRGRAPDPLTAVSNCIGNLRLIAGHDWSAFFERVSLVESVLRSDPAGAYAGMDFESRDRYRKAVEQIARGGGLDELSVARMALARATVASASAAPERETREPRDHVGYWLADEGRRDLEESAGARPAWPVRRERWIRRHARPLYFGSIALLALGALGALATWIAGARPTALEWGLLLGTAAIPALGVGVSLANWLASHAVDPHVLPKLDLGDGVPRRFATLVAVPALLGDDSDVEQLLEKLEVLWQGNRGRAVFFALLTDFADAPRERMPGDEELLRAAVDGVRRLNERHAGDGPAPFLLLHRERRWNPAEGCWMGWERKRGKLHELDRLLLDGDASRFAVREGALDRLPEIRFVLTLDADTGLPPGAAPRLIGTLAHPLNRPVVDPDGRVRRGYTVLQPRIEIVLREGASAFARLGQGETGLDLYSHAISDVYQDLFGEGIYAGKGIYDVRAFERSLAGRVPENALLSHDLWEGVHGRAALVSDVHVLEDFPGNVLGWARRLHRWVRGDWQLLPWLFPRVPGADGGWIPNRLDAVDRWKIADNLRRSLVAPSTVALLVSGWLSGVGSAWAWTAIGAGALGLPTFFGAASATRRLLRRAGGRLTGRPSSPLLRSGRRSFGVEAGRWLFGLVLLPYEAIASLDAVGRTLGRLFVTRRHLLQWTSAAATARLVDDTGGVRPFWRDMGVAAALGAGTLVAAALAAPASLPGAALLAVPWIASPGIARRVSRPVEPRPAEVTAGDRRALRTLALHTWLFFERFMDSENHWLPPDNFQEGREPPVARRTSPTNIGMALSAALAAYDLGYIGALQLEAIVRNTLDSMKRLERYRGHFLNWYSTRDLTPLEPRYVSTVDSGNLAAALLALGRGLREVPREAILRPAHADGLRDTIAAFSDVLETLEGGPGREAVAELRALLARVDRQVGEASGPADLVGLAPPAPWLEQADRLVVRIAERAQSTTEQRRALRGWSRKLHQHVQMLARDGARLAPWLGALRHPPRLYAEAGEESELGRAWRELRRSLPARPALEAVPDICVAGGRRLAELARATPEAPAEAVAEAREWRTSLDEALRAAAAGATDVRAGLHELARRSIRLVDEMEFAFLFDAGRHLFHIGYDVSAGELDAHYYDLLASEARLASFLAIARGEVPVAHWLHLGRPFVRIGGSNVLLSWGATMFEYLLPTLYMKAPPSSLLGHSCRMAVRRQRAFANRWGIPWGISESAYHRVGVEASYQYRAFGVPELGLKRDLGGRVVVSPYASLLALPLVPTEVVRNLRRLLDLGALGGFGLYEALDFGSPDGGPARRPAIVRAHMAHHQGMILAALDNYLNGGVMAERFHSDPRVAAAEYLLHEEIPWEVPTRRAWTRPRRALRRLEAPPSVEPWVVPAEAFPPRVATLSNGAYRVAVTARGGGGSGWRDIELTRWWPDAARETVGRWLYLADLDSGAVRSLGHDPAGPDPEWSETRFSPHMVELQRRDAGLYARLRIAVSPDAPVEVRRLAITNESGRPRRLAVVDYGEVVLASGREDRRHPAWVKLFVESEWIEERSALVFRRRPRGADEEPLYFAHAIVGGRKALRSVQAETDRRAFLGRGGGAERPEALGGSELRLAGTTGATLDPVFAVGGELELAPLESVELAFVSAAGRSRSAVLALIEEHDSLARCAWTFERARVRTELELHELGLVPADAQELERLLAALIHPDPRLRAPAEALAANEGGQEDLWALGISGDHPILLLHVREPEAIDLPTRLLRAHRYWRLSGVPTDLVFLDEASAGYAQPLRDRLHAALDETETAAELGSRAGIHIVAGHELEPHLRSALRRAARALLDTEAGSLAEQLRPLDEPRTRLPEFVPVPSSPPVPRDTPPLSRPSGLRLENGWGGFDPEGKEYVVRVEPERPTPAPWVNVIANPGFGFLVSESGGGYTWSENAGEHRLTPWRNDPVLDEPSEVVYLRDEETGEVWSATPKPAGGAAPYETRHGAGFTTFRHRSHGLEQELELFCVPDAPIKVARLHLSELWDRPRRITVTCYAEWVLGPDRATCAPHVVPDYDPETRALLARCPFVGFYARRVAFLAASRPAHGLTTDRVEFLGRGGVARPDGLGKIGLSGTVEPGADPCAALQVHVDLPAGEETQLHFVLGEGADRDEALALVRRWRSPDAIQEARRSLEEGWDERLGAVAVRTPAPSLDLLVNRWLLYQTVAGRLWGRTGLYQSSGAFGFRDQLQDVVALLQAAPELARGHILEAAAHQFPDGDVLHWWHPGRETGVRTRCSDDLLWLPYAVAGYVRWTGDEALLDERVPFLEGERLAGGEEERYATYRPGPRSATVFEHCVRAIERGSTEGPHGLPLIGSGDWNDGLDRVGRRGKGESVWLGWFLCDVLRRFAPLCEDRDPELGEELRRRADALVRPLEVSGWDGAWYRRAYYDDGNPLGSVQNREARIDAISQAWAVLSGAADPERARRAMGSAWDRLFHEEDGLFLLLTPPFDRGPGDPGYIKGYPPGVRENGGQYSHAAAWVGWAFADLGDAERAHAVLRTLDPILRSAAPDDARLYRVEPYVTAADVYGVEPRAGRGGWTWYTGSAAWTYRLALERLLGIRRQGDRLSIAPCVPDDWEEYEVRLRHGEATYRIRVERAPGSAGCRVEAVELDGRELESDTVPLDASPGEREVRVRIGSGRGARAPARDADAMDRASSREATGGGS